MFPFFKVRGLLRRLSSHLESSLGSLGSSEQLPDSDSELDETVQRPFSLVKQESEASMDEDQLSFRDSLDLSAQTATHTDLERDAEQDHASPEGGGGPPALPDSGPPDEAAAEQEVTTSLAELNVNQSNNNKTGSVSSPSCVPLICLCGKNLPLTRNRDTEPEFV